MCSTIQDGQTKGYDMSSQGGESQKGMSRSSAVVPILILLTCVVLVIAGFLAWQEFRSEEPREVPNLSVVVQDHEGDPVEDAAVVLEVSTDVLGGTETVMKVTDGNGRAFLRIALQDDAQLDPPHQLNLDVNNDGEHDLSADIVLASGVWTTSQVYSWLHTTKSGLVVTLAEDFVASESEDDDSDTSPLVTAGMSVKKTTEETTATTTRRQSGSQQAQRPVQVEAVATQQEEQSAFPVVKTLSGVTVSFRCGDTGVKKVLESFDVWMSINESGRIVATIAVVESEVNPGLEGQSFIFNLEENGFENSVRVSDHSLAELRSYASSMIQEVGAAELENRRAAIHEANDFRCWYGEATVEREVQHSCSDGSTVSSDPVVVKINRETIEDTPVVTDGGAAGTYPLSVITVLDRRSTGRQDANNFAKAIAEQVASHRHNIALQALKSQCDVVVDQSVDTMGDTVSEEDDLLEEDLMEEDLLEGDPSEESGTSSAEPLPIMAHFGKVDMYITRSDGMRVDMEPFEATVIIDPDLIVTAVIDNAIVTDIVSYGLPESVDRNQATQRFANLMLSTLITAERQKRAEAFASLHGITDYTLP